MLKIKDNVNIEELALKNNMSYDSDSDYESGWSYSQYDRDGVFIDEGTGEIFGIEHDSLELLYDLIKSDLVEKVD